MYQEYGPLAKFMYRVERKCKCEFLSWKDEEFQERDKSWEPVRNYWSTIPTPDDLRTNKVRRHSGDEYCPQRSKVRIMRRKYKIANCGKRSCYSCQRPRMRRWKKKIVERADSSARKLYFVTLTLPGDDDGRWSWSSNLQSSLSELQDWWKLSRVKVNVGKARGKAYVNSTQNCVRVFEIPENENGSWNPHVHVLTESDRGVAAVRQHWRSVWQKGDTKPRLQVKPVISENELADYVTKVTKYMTKHQPGNPDIDTVMYRKHNVSFCGDWRYGVTSKEDE